MRYENEETEDFEEEPVEPLNFREVLAGMVGFLGYVLICCESDKLSGQVVVWAIGAVLLLAAVTIWRKGRCIMKIREVFVPLENEVIDGVPTPLIEWEEFWKTHSTDSSYIMAYVDENNKVID